MTCPHCGRAFARIDSRQRHIRQGRCEPPPRTVDVADLLARVDGLTHSAAARACGVDPSTIRRWRAKGAADPHVIAQCFAVLDGCGAHLQRKPGRSNQPGPFIDVHCTWSSDGWIVDAYKAGRNDPIDTIAMAAHAGQRWPTLHDAHRFARRRFGSRLMSLTPEAHDQEATA
jgi:hypothetical protein